MVSCFLPASTDNSDNQTILPISHAENYNNGQFGENKEQGDLVV